MKTRIVNQKHFVLIFVTILIVFGTQDSYGQTITAATPQPLTEATLHGSVVTLTLSGGTYARSIFDIREAVTVSGIDGVTIPSHQPDKESDTQITVELEFNGNFDTDSTLTFTVGADAIANYNGPALTAEIPVTAETTYMVGDVIPTLPSSGFWFPSRIRSGSYRFSNGITTITLLVGGHFIYDGITYTSVQGCTIENNRVTSGLVRVSTTNTNPGPEPEIPLEPEIPAEADYDHIEGPWLWMIAPGGNINDDNLSAASDQVITETQIAQSGVSEGDHFNELQWTSGRLLPTTVCGIILCSSDNVIDVVRAIGLTIMNQLRQYSAYALINIHSPRARDNVLMGVGSDDSIKVWLNGAVVYINDTTRRTEGIQNRFLVNLNAGNNLLLAKVCNSGMGGNDDWGMFFKIYLDPQDYTTSLPMNAEITEAPQRKGDVNGDGIVNIQDLVLVAGQFGQTGANRADVNGDGQVNIQDLVLVAGALGTTAAAPSLHPHTLEMLTATEIKQWLSAAEQLNLRDATSQRGILFLEQLLVVLTPKETALLPNYPNPFNPETWIPYHLSKDADVTLHIYAVNGTLVRTLTLGHQPAGMYRTRSRAAYWDGKNELGEAVASGVYFYRLTAGDFTATRRMLIRK